MHFEVNVNRYIIICSQPSRFLPQKEKGLRRGYGRSRRLRKSSGSSRSPSQSGEEYYTTDDEGKRKKHGSKDRKDKSRRGNSNFKVNNLFVGSDSSVDTEMHLKCLYFELIDKSKEEKGKSSKKKGDRDSKKRKVSLCYLSRHFILCIIYSFIILPSWLH